mmetsp:Transcript_50689/g.75786  ORF Transcript_50689/g.75786 Transcript_50689/m.75786 type:complete len:114 (+) Transcript_50689:182-523(+)
MTTICVARLMVERRCATIKTVRPTAAFSIASCTRCSLSASNADVASSSNRMRGLTRMERAMATRCFWPPLSFTPRSPTNVSYPFGHFMMKSCAFALRQASIISSSLTTLLSTP